MDTKVFKYRFFVDIVAENDMQAIELFGEIIDSYDYDSIPDIFSMDNLGIVEDK